MVCATVACALLSCTHQHSESADSHSHPSESSVTSVHLDSADRVRLGIETAVINPDTFRSAIKVAGEIIPSSTDQYQITSPGAGVLRFATDLRPGLQISSGQTVAYVDASAVSGATVDKTSAAELAAAKREYLRLQSLRDEGLATVDELNAALSRYETAGPRIAPRLPRALSQPKPPAPSPNSLLQTDSLCHPASLWPPSHVAATSHSVWMCPSVTPRSWPPSRV